MEETKESLEILKEEFAELENEVNQLDKITDEIREMRELFENISISNSLDNSDMNEDLKKEQKRFNDDFRDRQTTLYNGFVKGDIQKKERKEKLKLILENSNKNDFEEIMKEETLKDAHIYCKIENLSGQVSGPLIENYIRVKYGMKKNNPSLCIGDLQYNEHDLEIKVSLGGKQNHKFNYVQIRMNHHCEYILTAYYLCNENLDEDGEMFIFKLGKNEMKHFILEYGGYAHGTKKKLGDITIEDLDNIENEKEYAIRPKYGDECWKELLRYRIEEIRI